MWFCLWKKIRENSAEKSHRTNNAHKLDNKNKKYRTMTLKYKTTTRRAKTIKYNMKIKNSKKKTRSMINTTPKWIKTTRKWRKGRKEGGKKRWTREYQSKSSWRGRVKDQKRNQNKFREVTKLSFDCLIHMLATTKSRKSKQVAWTGRNPCGARNK